MKYRFLVFLIAAALLAVPAAYGNEGKIILNPAGHSAQVYENFSASMKFTGDQTIISVLNSTLQNGTQEISGTASHNTFVNLTDAIKGNASAAVVANLILTLEEMKTMSAGALFYNVSLAFEYNVTGIFTSNTWNLSWRSASFHADLSSYFNSTYMMAVGALSMYVNMSGMSIPLTEWTKLYNSTTNVTTFSHSSSGTAAENMTINGLTISLSYDPSFTIVAPGNATAGTDTISYGSAAPVSSHLDTELLYAIIGVIVIISAGTAALAFSRKGRKR